MPGNELDRVGGVGLGRVFEISNVMSDGLRISPASVKSCDVLSLSSEDGLMLSESAENAPIKNQT